MWNLTSTKFKDQNSTRLKTELNLRMNIQTALGPQCNENN